MDKHQLLTTLEGLHTDLSQAEQVDPETLESLRRVMDDIHRLLSRPGTVASTAGDLDQTKSRLGQLVLEFEASHPRLVSAIQHVADSLANLGV